MTIVLNPTAAELVKFLFAFVLGFGLAIIATMFFKAR